MLCPLSDQILIIIFHKNRTFIFLMQMISFDILVLRYNKIHSPADFRYEFINSHDLCLRGYFNVDPLFSGADNWKTTSPR